MSYDLTQSGKGNFPTIPDGRYVLKAESVEVEPHIDKKKNEGHRFSIKYSIVGGDYDGRKVWDNIYTPSFIWKMRTLLEVGGSPEINNKTATAESIAAAIPGLVVTAMIKNGTTQNNNPRTDVTDYASQDAPTGTLEDPNMPAFLR